MLAGPQSISTIWVTRHQHPTISIFHQRDSKTFSIAGEWVNVTGWLFFCRGKCSSAELSLQLLSLNVEQMENMGLRMGLKGGECSEPEWLPSNTYLTIYFAFSPFPALAQCPYYVCFLKKLNKKEVQSKR